MAKRRSTLDDDLNQPSLFELLSQSKAEESNTPPEGSMDIRSRLRGSLSVALKAALPKSRFTVADEMTSLLGFEITKFQIDSWCAESKEGHRMPAEYLPAFCQATGSIEPLRLLNECCNVFTVKGPDALRADIRRDEEALKAKQQEIKKKVALLSALETPQIDRRHRS